MRLIISILIILIGVFFINFTFSNFGDTGNTLVDMLGFGIIIAAILILGLSKKKNNHSN